MYMFPGSPIAIFTGLYAALASAVANLVTRRRWTAALLTGFLVSLLPQVEARIAQQPLYYRLMSYWYRSMSRVYRLLHPRESAEEERYRENMERLGIDPETGMPPELVTLERVIPVGQTQRLEEASLIMLSIESYAEGFLIHGRLLMDRAREEPRFFDPSVEHSVPEIPALVVRDDRGHLYQAMSGGGSGGRREFRHEFRIRQPLDPQARELVLEVPEIRWQTFSPGKGAPRDDQVMTGPWRFTAAL